MNIKAYIPNFITLLNLLSGCFALVFVAQNQFYYAFFFVSLGIFFDFFDGFFARLFKVQSPLGVQLDSLADMVTSGAVPGFVMYQLLFNYLNSGGVEVTNYMSLAYVLPLFGFVITLGSCYRLAKFNIDTRQTDSFIGLPTPANALFILSIPLIIDSTSIEGVRELLTNPYVLMGITIVSAYILNAEIPLFSLKMKGFSWQKSKIQFIFLLLAMVLLVGFKILGLPLVILLYILLSIVQNKMTA
ncbi:CDP-alcohol phosphatidyltransferase family protein [Flavobacterium sp.]|uniref:CDP-alcohol phosphatidyltransferase family protein n=1 Tax=Flavobacterium sp. TaxID=239 RepID=UPI002633F674|nr:CDP-alcohol phosphatidyltransferase family protein [Flavobacterium sp.]MDD2986265.1 CDP-alcohol phosphatidyltransferase family protein [Flavobacterium sp.]